MAASRLAVGMPVRNGAAHIAPAIEALLGQTFAAFDLVVFDNASTDETREIVRQFRDDRIRLVESGTNIGPVANFNRAFAETEGELFLWAADDDELAPTFIERCVAELDADEDAIAATTWAEVIDDRGQRVDHAHASLDLASRHRARRIRAYLRSDFFYQVYGVVRRSEMQPDPFRPVLGGDVVVVWEWLLKGPVRVVPEELLRYRRYERETRESVTGPIGTRTEPPAFSQVRLWKLLDSLVNDPTYPDRRRLRSELCMALPVHNWRHGFAADFALAASKAARTKAYGRGAMFAAASTLLAPSRTLSFVRRRLPGFADTT